MTVIWPQVNEAKRFQEFIKNSKTGASCVLNDIEFSRDSFHGLFHLHVFRLPDMELAISFEKQSRRLNFHEHLKKREKHIVELIKSTNLPWWEWNIPENKIVLGENLAHLTGNGIDREQKSNDFWPKVIHPDDLDNVTRVRQNFTRENVDSYQVSYRIKDKNGSFLDVSERGKISGWDESLRARRFIGVLTQVSETEEQAKH